MRLAQRPAARYGYRMTAADIKALPVKRKIQIMEAIWEDLRDRFERLEVSPQQKALLDRRRQRVREGAARLLDWEAVKGTLGKP
jgi:putative addiction module component (TIGR02574 family)